MVSPMSSDLQHHLPRPGSINRAVYDSLEYDEPHSAEEVADSVYSKFLPYAVLHALANLQETGLAESSHRQGATYWRRTGGNSR
jgi:hypothetical protein